MRISDWSSDVCSSDLHRPPRRDACIMRGIGLVEIDLVGQVLSIHGNVEMVVDLVSHAGVKAPVGRDAACHDLRRGVHSNYAAGILRGRSVVLTADRKSPRLNYSH